jgi:malic enzyme
MNKNPIILALANPTPEIMPNEAYEGGAFVNLSFNNQKDCRNRKI